MMSMTQGPMNERRAEIQQIAKRFEDRLRLARASELASYGHLLEAEALLCPGMHLPMSSDELDMLARIHVMQGRYDLARRRWEDAAKSGDCRAEFEECIKVLDDWLAFRQCLLIWRIKLALCLTTILLSIWILVKLSSVSSM